MVQTASQLWSYLPSCSLWTGQPLAKTARRSPERWQSWTCVGELPANITGSGLSGHDYIQRLRFAESWGLAWAGEERIIATKTQEKDSGFCKKRMVGGGGHGIELKTLEFLTRTITGTGNCEAGSAIRRGTRYRAREQGGPWILELSLGS